MKILVVEDELKTGDYLRQGLMEAGFVVDLVRNGEDGLLTTRHRQVNRDVEETRGHRSGRFHRAGHDLTGDDLGQGAHVGVAQLQQ